MFTALECGADVRERRFASGWIESGDFGDNIGFCTVEKFVDGPGRRAKAAVVVGRAVPRGVDSGDLEGILAAPALQKSREGASDVAITNEGDPQEIILAGRAGRTPWSAADAHVGLQVRSTFEERGRGDPRGPGGPTYFKNLAFRFGY
jgi:hypothetical protein